MVPNLFPFVREEKSHNGLIAVVGALVGLMARYLGGKENILGTAGIIQSVEIAGGRLRYQHYQEKLLPRSFLLGPAYLLERKICQFKLVRT